MNNKIVGIIICLLLVGTILPATGNIIIDKIPLSFKNGNTLYVGGTGPDNYTKIQDAIDNASDGDTVFVYNGIYHGYVRVDKSISLIGENKNTTIIEGEWGCFVNIRKDFVLVTGFTVRECGFDHCGGITIYSNNVTIVENILIQNFNEGIIVLDDNNLITNNTIICNPTGIGLEGKSHNNTVVGNVILSNIYRGIAVESWYPSNNNIIGENIIKNNGCGIEITNGNNTCITNNLIMYNGYGIEIQGEYWPEELTYRNNTIIDNNTIAFNNYGLVFDNANNTHVHHNNIINNSEGQAYDNAYNFQAINLWDNGYPSGGNYWSNYNGKDNYSGPNQDILGNDGFGDTPYNIPGYGINSKDRYPLMKPFGNKPPDLPTIKGPMEGKIGVEYNYTFSISDPDEDELYLLIDWGDGTDNNWTSGYGSGEQVVLKHIWNKKGIYTIRAKVKDIVGAESEWGTFDVTIPKTRGVYYFNWLSFLERFPIVQKLLNRFDQ